MSTKAAGLPLSLAEPSKGRRRNRAFSALLEACASMHRHLCPRQVLGVRMGLLAGKLLDLELPQGDGKQLFVFMETDGCGADGVSVATGCWVGRRTLRIVHFGKMAATFVDRKSGRAYRIRPHLESRRRALRVRPDAPNRWQAMLEAYQIMPDGDLLEAQPVRLTADLEALVGRPGVRAACEACGEEIINQRQIERSGRTLCRACAQGTYYEPVG